MTETRSVATASQARPSPVANRASGAKAIIAGAKAASAPYDALVAALQRPDAPEGWWREGFRISLGSGQDSIIAERRLRDPDEGRASDARKAVEAWLAFAPEVLQLEVAAGAYQREADKPAKDGATNQVRAIVSLMVDAFPNARPHAPETYFEVLVDQVLSGDFALSDVARAYQGIVAKAKFLPAPSEFIEACEQARKDGESILRRAERGIAAVARAKAALVNAAEKGPFVYVAPEVVKATFGEDAWGIRTSPYCGDA